MRQEELDIRLVELRENKQLTQMHRWEFMRYSGTAVDVELSTNFRKDGPKRLVVLELGAHYSTMRGQIRRRLLDYVVDAEFEINDIDGVIDADREELVLTTDLLRLMLSIAIGAIRGMIALRTSGTFLVHYPLPVYNLDEMVDNIVAAGAEVAYNPMAY